MFCWLIGEHNIVQEHLKGAQLIASGVGGVVVGYSKAGTANS